MSILNRGKRQADPVIQQQRQQADADRHTAKATASKAKASKAEAKATQAKNKVEIQRRHGASHGIMVFKEEGKSAGRTKTQPKAVTKGGTSQKKGKR